jgi:hypothetical protein
MKIPFGATVLKPDFPMHARVLIRHYIKFKEIVERVIDELRRPGLNVENN